MDEEEAIRQAMSILGARRTDRKIESATKNIARANAAPMTEERRAKIREAQQARRERERAALGADAVPTEKRPPGRPRKQQEAGSVADCDTAPKRGRGRPRKKLTQMTDTNG